MLLRGLHIKPGADRTRWPYTIPAVAQIARDGLEFSKPVTFLVGENGSGKSTLVEAIAEAYGINPRGGHGTHYKATTETRSPLAGNIDFAFTPQGGRNFAGRKHSRNYFLRAESAFDILEFATAFNVIVPGYPQEDLSTLSHGEGYLAVFRTVFNQPGLYLMDEPEAALSFTACLHLVATLHEIADTGAQVICATHSPVLASTPGADILELTDTGIQHTTWNDLQLVEHWRRYLDNPQTYLRHLID